MPKAVAYPLNITTILQEVLALTPSHLNLTLEYHPNSSPMYRIMVRHRHRPDVMVCEFENTDELSFYLCELLSELKAKKAS